MNAAPQDEGLKRVVGVSGLGLNIVNLTIGAGIFALPAIVSIQLGAFSIFAYIFCGVMLASIMMCYAEIGTRVTSAGGTYAYVEAAFGDLPGFVVNWMFVFGWAILADAALMNIIADSLAVIFPVFSDPWIRGLLFLALLGFMVFINIRGAKEGVGFVKFITAVKLLPLIGIIIFGIGHVETANLHWESLPTFQSFGSTALVLFFAFAGFETALGVSGELKNPQRTVPLGILLGGVLVLAMYLLLQTVTQGVLGADMALHKDAPLAAVAERIVGTKGGTILLIAAAVSCFGAVSSDVLNSPRLLYAGAHDGLFPKFLGKVHPKYATPYMAILCHAGAVFIFAVSGGFNQLAILASADILIIYLAVILATIKLRRTKAEPTGKIFKAPGGLLFPIIGIASIIWLISSLARWEVYSILIFIAVITSGYFAMKWIKARKENTTA